MHKSIFTFFAFLVAAVFSSVLSAADIADSVYLDGKIWTGNSASPSAQAMAIKGNKLVAVGSSADLKKWIGPATKVVDLQGRRVTPGFIDNHTHFADAAGLLTAVQVRDASSREEFVERIGRFAKQMEPGKWMLMGVWDHEAWGGQLPEANWIDSVTADTPVYLWRTDGHMALANSRAMQLAGIDKNTADVAGGEIVRDKNGAPTGVFKDAAMELINRVVPPLTTAEQAEVFRRGVDHALSLGVTQIHDMGFWSHLQAFQKLRQAQQLKMRVYSFVPLDSHRELAQYVDKNGRGDAMHRWGGLKGLVDGSLGSTTAWFYKPYTDEPTKSGFALYDLDTFKGWIGGGDAAGLHVTVHAIGDRANDWLLDSFAEVAKNNPANAQRRWRIEHAQHLSESAIARIKKLSVIASMQPYHAIDDGRWAEKRIGAERIKTTYAFKSLFDAGAKVTFGSDAPVAPMNVMEGIYAAVTRRTLDGANPNGWVPAQKISVEQALQAYTVNSAYAGFQENSLGQLKPGYLADFVVLSRDIFSIPAVDIKDVVVDMTVVDGVVVYEAVQ